MHYKVTRRRFTSKEGQTVTEVVEDDIRSYMMAQHIYLDTREKMYSDPQLCNGDRVVLWLIDPNKRKDVAKCYRTYEEEDGTDEQRHIHTADEANGS